MDLDVRAAEKWFYRSKGSSNRFFAVQAADLSLRPGQVSVLTGRSGSGKTTLLHMMSGLLQPSGGSILADGQDLYALQEEPLSRFRNRHFGMIPQGANLLPELTVMENLLLPLGMYPGGDKTVPDKNGSADGKPTDPAGDILQLLERLEIGALADVPARELSGGERRRACIVRALAGRPEILFADEPTSDLDDENMHLVLSMLRKAADAGAAVFLVTHDSEALDYADVRMRMEQGVLNIMHS